MNHRPVVATVAGPSTRPLDEALRASPSLASLLARVRRSQALLRSVAPLLPGPLAAHVSAGPLDDEGWSLLCANASVAAKLRQLVPHLEQQLHATGQAVPAIRVKVQQG